MTRTQPVLPGETSSTRELNINIFTIFMFSLFNESWGRWHGLLLPAGTSLPREQNINIFRNFTLSLSSRKNASNIK